MKEKHFLWSKARPTVSCVMPVEEKKPKGEKN